MFNYRKSAVSAVLISALLFTGCGGSNSSSGGGTYKSDEGAYKNYAAGDSYAAEEAYAETEAAAEDYESPADYEYSDDYSNNAESRSADKAEDALKSVKMIYRANVTLETLEFEKAVDSIKADINSYNGFVESSSMTNHNVGWYRDDYIPKEMRQYNTVIRVPSSSFDAFLDGLKNYGQITSESTTAENVSRVYASNEVEIAALEKEQKLLTEMMNAAQDLDEMLTIEKRLTEIETKLNQYRTALAALDTDIQYSTVTLRIDEVYEYTEPEAEPIEPEPEPTFGQRLAEHLQETGSTFLGFLEGLLFIFISLFPYLLIIGIIVFIVIAVTKKKRKSAAPLPYPQNPAPTPPPAPAEEEKWKE